MTPARRRRALAVFWIMCVLLVVACREPMAVPMCDSAKVWVVIVSEDAQGNVTASDTLGYGWFPSTNCPPDTPSGWVPK